MSNANGFSYSQSYVQNRSASGPSKRPRVNPPRQAEPGLRSWRNCSVKGCKFVGSGEDVEQHEEDRHLIIPVERINKLSEEEEIFAGHKGFVLFNVP